jgi:hypothetical protein
MKIKTIEHAYAFVKEVKVCAIFGSEKIEHPSLWEHVDLPGKEAVESGWGEKISAIWRWKNELPALYPEEIFYGKIEGGVAVLMEMGYLRDTHFQGAYVPVSELSSLAQRIYEKVRLEPWTTTALRNAIMAESGTTKSRFDTALKSLQVSLNVVRSNDIEDVKDTWLAFKELYPDIWNLHVADWTA